VDYLYRSESKRFSQNGEDGVIAEILRRIGATHRYFTEFGADAGECNCAALAAAGWSGLFMESDPEKVVALEAAWRDRPEVTVRRAMVRPETVERLFAEAGVPADLDVLSIDVDSCDWHIWNALTAYRPRLLVIEYNGSLPLERRLVQPLEAGHAWDGTDWYGASLGAYEALAADKGYALVHTDAHGVNAFFVRDDVFDGSGLPSGPSAARHRANIFATGAGHPRDPRDRRWIDLDADGELVRL
jgi:hypothetical protein